MTKPAVEVQDTDTNCGKHGVLTATCSDCIHEQQQATIATLREAMAYVVDVGECLADDAQEALRSIVVNTTAALAETGNGEEG